MGRAGDQRPWKIAGALHAPVMEGVHAGSEVLRFAAHLVERHQAVVDVEDGVLQPLRHHRTGDLLELHGEVQHHLTLGHRKVLGVSLEQHVLEPVEQRGVGGGVGHPGAGDGPLDVVRVALVHAGSRRDVRPVDREMGDEANERPADGDEGEVPGAAVHLRDAVQLAGEPVDLAGHAHRHHLLLLLCSSDSKWMGWVMNFS
jgi:hypothetical protein